MPDSSTGRRWLPVAAAVSVAGWGANQFTPLALAPMSELAVVPSRLVTGFTSGVLLSAGAFVAAVVAEWLPHPMVLPCMAHGALALLVWLTTRRTPETAAPSHPAAPPANDPDLRRAAVQHPRFLRVVLPASPAVFEAATVAYVVLPPLVIGQVAGYAPVFSGLVAAATIGMGLAVQPVAAWLEHPASARSTLVAMAMVIVGLLAGAAAVHQGVTYSGFLAPLLLAVTASAAAYPVLLAGMAGVGLVFLVLTAVYSRRHLPEVVAVPTTEGRHRASLERSAPWAE